MQETLQPIIVALVITNFFLLIDMQETLQTIIVTLVITNFLH